MADIQKERMLKVIKYCTMSLFEKTHRRGNLRLNQESELDVAVVIVDILEIHLINLSWNFIILL